MPQDRLISKNVFHQSARAPAGHALNVTLQDVTWASPLLQPAAGKRKEMEAENTSQSSL